MAFEFFQAGLSLMRCHHLATFGYCWNSCLPSGVPASRRTQRHVAHLREGEVSITAKGISWASAAFLPRARPPGLIRLGTEFKFEARSDHGHPLVDDAADGGCEVALLDRIRNPVRQQTTSSSKLTHQDASNCSFV
jgi:hypothetical protein